MAGHLRHTSVALALSAPASHHPVGSVWRCTLARPCLSDPEPPSVFVSAPGTRVTTGRSGHVRPRSARIGVRDPPTAHRPRLHDLRHRFAVQTLVRWSRASGRCRTPPARAVDLPRAGQGQRDLLGFACHPGVASAWPHTREQAPRGRRHDHDHSPVRACGPCCTAARGTPTAASPTPWPATANLLPAGALAQPRRHPAPSAWNAGRSGGTGDRLVSGVSGTTSAVPAPVAARCAWAASHACFHDAVRQAPSHRGVIPRVLAIRVSVRPHAHRLFDGASIDALVAAPDQQPWPVRDRTRLRWRVQTGRRVVRVDRPLWAGYHVGHGSRALSWQRSHVRASPPTSRIRSRVTRVPRAQQGLLDGPVVPRLAWTAAVRAWRISGPPRHPAQQRCHPGRPTGLAHVLRHSAREARRGHMASTVRSSRGAWAADRWTPLPDVSAASLEAHAAALARLRRYTAHLAATGRMTRVGLPEQPLIMWRTISSHARVFTACFT